MKLRDLTDFDRDDVLGALGLQSKSSTTSWVLGTLGLFGLGMVIGAGVALMLAPKPGAELRRELEDRIRNVRDRIGNGQQQALDTSNV
jgi:gas vesicle protein